MKPSDSQLIQRLAKDDPEAFQTLVERYMNIAYSAAAACLHSKDLAYDACQLTFIELHSKSSKLHTSNLGGWIFITSRNMALKIQREETRRKKRELKYSQSSEPTATSEIDWQKLTPEIHQAIASLKPADRDSIILRYFQQMSFEEISTTLGASPDAIRMRVNRALQNLNKSLSKKGITSTTSALAAALPLHSLTAAPPTFSQNISSSFLSHTHTSLAHSLSISASIMKTKTIIIGASTLLIGTSAIFLIPSEAPPSKTPPSRPTLPPPSPVTKQAPPAPEEPQENSKVQPQATTTPQAFQLSSAIDPQLLTQSKELLEVLEKLGGGARVISDKPPAQLTQLLANRLSLSEEQTQKAQQIFETYFRQRYEPQDQYNALSKFPDRTAAIHFMALSHAQRSNKQAFEASPELQAYSQKINAQIQQGLGFDFSNYDQRVPDWDKNPSVLKQISQFLDDDQKRELQLYVNDSKSLQTKQQMYRRYYQISKDLGLNKEERASLYNLLSTNPEAPVSEIKAILPADLQQSHPPIY